MEEKVKINLGGPVIVDKNSRNKQTMKEGGKHGKEDIFKQMNEKSYEMTVRELGTKGVVGEVDMGELRLPLP